MTVEELIVFLSQQPLDMEVMVNGYEMYYQAPKKTEVVDMWYIGPHAYCGDHDTNPPWNSDDDEDDGRSSKPGKKVVLIGR